MGNTANHTLRISLVAAPISHSIVKIRSVESTRFASPSQIAQSMTSVPIVPKFRRSGDARLRLYCLPYAGGGSAPFFRWRKSVPAWVDLVPLTLPGHDGRLTEPPRTDLQLLAAELAAEIQPVDSGPYVLLGHSMGAWLAFELARVLRRRGAQSPALLVVAAARAPHFPLSESPIYKLPDSELVDAIDRRYGGIPAQVRNSPELLRLLLPPLRADLQMIETYQYTDEPPLGVEIFALGGSEDRAVSAAQLEGWRCHATQSCSVQRVHGGHFFLFPGQDSGEAGGGQARRYAAPTALQILVDRLQQCLPSLPAPL
jgi:medium-chain acyl-[acyl-carrier-protein] hydrolase